MPPEIFRLIVEHLFYGVLIFQFIYNIILYKNFAEKATLFYNIYIIVLVAYFLNIRFEYIDLIRPNYVQWEDWKKITVSIFEPPIYIAYFFFAKNFLNSKTKFPKTNRIINIMICISATEVVVPYLLLWMGNFQLAIVVSFICKPLNMLVAAYTFYLFYKNSKLNKLTQFIFIGGVIILLGNVFYHFFKSITPFLFNQYFEPYDILRMSFVIDILVFSSGLAYKYQFLNKKRTESINNEINTLKETYLENQALEQMLNRKIQGKLTEIEYSNKLLLEKKLEKKVLDLQRDLLRIQMNPHFLFNSLNSIKAAIIEDEIENALNYLTHYVYMIRSIMVQSKSKHITLSEELKSISSYLALENVRFNNELTIQIKVDDSVNSEVELIAPLLIQPFIENALWHGLKPKKNGMKKLSISIKKENALLNVEIHDNGVGRKSDKKSLKKHQSRSLTIIEERMNILKKMYQTNAHYQIEDLKDMEQNSIGTLVQLYIPLLTRI